MKLTSTQSRELNFIRALVHGDSGIGKTTSLQSLPKGRTLIAAAERGLLPLRNCDFPVFSIEAWDDIRQLVRVLAHPIAVNEKSITVNFEGRELEVAVLAIDSLSELSRLCKKQIIEVDRKKVVAQRNKAKNASNEKDTPDGIYDEQMTQEDWGIYGTRMSNMVSAVCHLPMHVIFTSLSNEKDDKKSGMTLRRPNVQGAFAAECPAAFDFVFHMEVGMIGDVETRVWRTVTDGQIMAKDASGILPPFIKADWPELFRIIFPKVKKEKPVKEAKIEEVKQAEEIESDNAALVGSAT